MEKNLRPLNKASIFGRILEHLDRKCENLRRFISNRNKAVEVFFLLIYVALQITLLLSGANEIVIGIFIILFLFFLSLKWK